MKTSEAKPFLKWAGGKTQILDRILPHVPSDVRMYFEPFVGGGAVFFALANARRFRSATISDGNAALIEAYMVVKNNLARLIKVLGYYQKNAKHEAFFYETRAADPKKLSAIDRVARFIYLNKTCFRGLYRVNSKGVFNTPFGHYVDPDVVCADNLRACAEALENAVPVHCDFAKVFPHAREGDVIYADPPYAPKSKTSNFVGYTSDGFDMPDHTRLIEACSSAAKHGATVLLSSAGTPAMRALLSGRVIDAFSAKRAINPEKASSASAKEILAIWLPGQRTEHRARKGA